MKNSFQNIIPKNLKNIGEEAFFGCEKIPKIILPSKVEFIDDSAFANCFNLSKLTLNEGLLGIGSYAFELNKKLKKCFVEKIKLLVRFFGSDNTFLHKNISNDLPFLKKCFEKKFDDL